jgi:Spy/CpxP family protein refolding chaperone
MKRYLLTLIAASAIALAGFVMVQAQPQPGGGGRGHGKRFMVERLAQDLNLTSEQQAKVQPIIDQAKPQIAAIHREAMQKTKAAMDSMMSQIRPLLTPDQQKKLDDIQNQKRSSRRHDSSIRENSAESDD